MAAKNDPRIITPMPSELVKAIEDYQFENRFRTRADAIRSLIEFALQCKAQGVELKKPQKEKA